MPGGETLLSQETDKKNMPAQKKPIKKIAVNV